MSEDKSKDYLFLYGSANSCKSDYQTAGYPVMDPPPAFSIAAPPMFAGYWVVGETWKIRVTHAPTDAQAKNTLDLLGWRWEPVQNKE